jgi:hypothetical protein
MSIALPNTEVKPRPIKDKKEVRLANEENHIWPVCSERESQDVCCPSKNTERTYLRSACCCHLSTVRTARTACCNDNDRPCHGSGG